MRVRIIKSAKYQIVSVGEKHNINNKIAIRFVRFLQIPTIEFIEERDWRHNILEKFEKKKNSFKILAINNNFTTNKGSQGSVSTSGIPVPTLINKINF